MKTNWKTTTAGIASLVLAALQITTNHSAASDPQVLTAIAAGIGLLLARDAAKK